jgi:hypothetical protein
MPPRRRADLIVAFPNHGQRQSDFDTPISESVLSRAWPMTSDSYPAVDREIDRILNCTQERLTQKELLRRIMRFSLDFEANGTLLTQIIAYLMGVAAAPVGQTSQNQTQTLTRGADVDGGTFRVLMPSGVTPPFSGAVAWNVSAVNLKTAIEALPSIGAGNTTVSFNAGVWSIEFINDLATVEMPLFIVDDDDLTASNDIGDVTAAVINNPGTGYTVGDDLTLTGGNNDAVLNVDTVSGGGVITGVSIVTPGTGYTSALGVGVTGGTGNDDATFDITAFVADKNIVAAEDAPAVLPQRAQIQVLTIVGGSAGTLRLGLPVGQYTKYTSRLVFNPTAAQMKAALENLVAVGRNNVTVALDTSTPGTRVYTITHVSNLLYAELTPYVLDDDDLTATSAVINETQTGVQLEHDITEITGFQPPAFGFAVGYKTSNRRPRKYDSVAVDTLRIVGSHAQPRVTVTVGVVGSGDVQDVSSDYVLPGCQIFRPIRFKDCVLIINDVNYSNQPATGNRLMDFELSQSNGLITDDDAYTGQDEDIHRLERADIRSLVLNVGILAEKGDDIYQLAEENAEVPVTFQIGRSNDSPEYIIAKASLSLRNPETVYDGTAKRTKVQIAIEPEEDDGGATWYSVLSRIGETATLLTAA